MSGKCVGSAVWGTPQGGGRLGTPQGGAAFEAPLFPIASPKRLSQTDFTPKISKDRRHSKGIVPTLVVEINVAAIVGVINIIYQGAN
jgi:hypothetical protein